MSRPDPPPDEILDWAAAQTVPDLGRLLRQLRRRHARRHGRSAVTYRELAATTGWSLSTIAEYFGGTVLPPTDRFDVLVGLLGAGPVEQGLLATARDRIEECRRGTASHRPAVVTLPRELPAPVPGFSGRTSYLSRLDGLLSRAGRPSAVLITALSGAAGIGKTALAVQWAHRIADQYPDGQLYADLHGYDSAEPVAASEVLGRFLRSLGVDGPVMPDDVAERAARYRTLLAGRRVLVVLDNARTAEQVRPLLPGSSSCLVLITSRADLAGLVARDGAERMDVDLLRPDEAATLLRTLIGPRVDAEPDAAARLAEYCGRLPLALRLAAELAAARPGLSVAELSTDLRDVQRRLDLLDAGGDPRAVRGVFSWSVRHLSPVAARTFASIGLHPGRDFDVHAVAALNGTDAGPAQRALDELTRARLVSAAGDRYTMHDLMRAYAAERSGTDLSPEAARAASTRLFDYYVSTAVAANNSRYTYEPVQCPPGVRAPRSAPPVDQPDLAQRWLDAERANVVAISPRAKPRHQVGLSLALGLYLHEQGHFRDALTVHRAAAAHAVASNVRVLSHLAMTYLQLGDFDAAIVQLRLALARQRANADRAGEAAALAHLGVVHQSAGHYRTAVEQYQAALALYRAAGERRRAAGTLINLGHAYERLGRFADATAVLEDCVTAFRELGERPSEAYALCGLARVQHRLGLLPAARELLEQSLALAHEYRIQRLLPYQLAYLGSVYRAQGNLTASLAQLDHAWSIVDAGGDRLEQLTVLNELGATLHALRRPVDALARYRAAVGLARRIGERHELARALDGAAAVLSDAGWTALAGRCWQEALVQYTDLGVPEAAELRDRLARPQSVTVQ